VADPLHRFAGSIAYVDAVTLIAYLDADHPFHASCRAFMARVLDPNQPIELVTASLTQDEVTFVLLQELLARPPYEVTRDRARYLDGHPEVVRALTRLIAGPVVALGNLLRVEAVTAEDTTHMLQVMASHGLLPRDAIHYAVARRLGISAIVSDDDRFDGLSGLRLYQP
jgi:predicted nucleic acid-binding protein